MTSAVVPEVPRVIGPRVKRTRAMLSVSGEGAEMVAVPAVTKASPAAFTLAFNTPAPE